MVAGPSEIGIIADGNANPDEVTADLLSQAEHDRRARAMLVTDSVELAEAVSAAVDQQLKTLPRQEIAQEAIANRSFIAVMADQDEMFELMNSIAPEHLELQVQDPITAMGKVQNAGSVFLGRYASEPLGDYLAGPNHVLPTGGTARFASPLGVYDFVKRTQFLQYTEAALAGVVQEVADLARAEGLEAHARAVEARFKEEIKMRTATIKRQTKETQIEVSLNLDQQSGIQIDTGVGYFDHMLNLLAKHGRFGLVVKATGDLEVDAHHTVEDTGIVLGEALKEALGDKV